MKKAKSKSLISRSILAASAFAMVGFGVGEASAQNIHKQGRVTPDYVVVAPGDTMWDLSGAYYGDTYMWPRMWGYNAHITNPHWIYPGDIMYLKSPTAVAGNNNAQNQVSVVQQAGQTGSVQLPVAGFVSKERVEYAGRIIASPKPAAMLSPLDKAWIGFGDEAYSEEEKENMEDSEKSVSNKAAKPNVGDVYAVIREVGTLENEDEETEGYKYMVIGTIRVTEVSEKYHETGEILQAWQEIQRGDYLIPYERQLKVVQPVQSDKDMVAKIVDSIDPITQFGEQHYVFVNKGADDGLRNGNRLFVYQRFEGISMDTEDEKIPWQRVGQVLVLDVRKNYSLAVITDSSREISIGDRLEMYAGY